jgi:multiple sugar transport system substrate-binding protein
MWISPYYFTGGLSWMALTWQNGGQLFSEDGMEATFNQEPGVDALTWMRSLVEDGYSPENVDQDADHVAFTQGKNAFHWNGIWQAQNYAEVDGLNYGVAPLPQIGSQRAAWAGSHNFVITQQADEDQQQAAAVFIKYIIDHSVEWAKAGQVPASAEVRESTEFQELDYQSTLAEQLEYVQFPPAVPGIAGVIDPVMIEGYQSAILGNKEPQASLDEAAGQADQLLEENASQYGA